jgi:NAD(P)-dependent dehydrogenase (short-subunit alcohol dehydrogenase family)
MQSTTERVAIITGASRGIGSGLVKAYCKIGYHVIAHSRHIGDADDPEIHTVAGDIADPSTAERATGVEVAFRGHLRQFAATSEVVLAPGAIHTPKTLMLSGIGDENSLRQLGIPVVVHPAGVGRNFQNHILRFSVCPYEKRNGK